MKLEFSISSPDVDKMVKQVTKDSDVALKGAFYDTGFRILAAARKDVPIDTGNLIGSGSVVVGKGPVFTEDGSKADVNISGIQNYELRVSYNTIYAYIRHEFPFMPGKKSLAKGVKAPGYKWLSKAINARDWMKYVFDFYIDRMNERK